MWNFRLTFFLNRIHKKIKIVLRSIKSSELYKINQAIKQEYLLEY